jgi:hypothetical protein
MEGPGRGRGEDHDEEEEALFQAKAEEGGSFVESKDNYTAITEMSHVDSFMDPKHHACQEKGCVGRPRILKVQEGRSRIEDSLKYR